ncbi:UpxY family transcription antiterminator [Schleiferiaceae bacterium]|nr:UpxY family transcription antiterminator [Schleiferiaceae bacterium]
MLNGQDQFIEHDKTKSWYVLYTKPRHEKKLAERLISEGWTVYCPLKKVVKQWSDRKKVVQEALFPSFIFIQCRDKDRNKVFQNVSAVRYLYWLGRPAEVRADDIQSIRHWMGEVYHQANNIECISVGSSVRLDAGPLMGRKGKIVEYRGVQVTVLLEQLQIQVCFNVQETPLALV